MDRKSGVGFEEWKKASTAEGITVTMPERYVRCSTGGWQCPPGETAASVYDLSYRVRTDAELHPLFIQNLKFLQDFWIHEYPVTSVQEEQVLACLSTTPGISVAQLLNALSDLLVDVVWALLTHNHIFTNLSAASLMQWDQVMLYFSGEEAEHDARQIAHLSPSLPLFLRICFDGRLWEGEKQGETVLLHPEVGPTLTLPVPILQRLFATGQAVEATDATPSALTQETREILFRAGPTQLQTANRRLSTMLAYVNGDPIPVTARSVQKWLKAFRQAEAAYGCGYLGLIDKSAQRGNREIRVEKASKELLVAFLKSHYAVPQAKRASVVYVLYCEEQALRALEIAGVQALCVDEAQHLMHSDATQRPGVQLDWLKSLTNRTNVLYILVGNFSLYDFCHLNGQAARRMRDEHFARYHFTKVEECENFIGALKALLLQVPLQVDIAEMLTHWRWFGEWSIGCIGILSDWVVETVSSITRAGKTTLTIDDLKKHALKPDQRFRLETEARTGEFKIEQAKAKSEQEWQELVKKPQALPNGSPNHQRETNVLQSPPPRAGKRIERAAHRDSVGTEGTPAVREASGKCSFLGPIGVTNQQFQESSVWHVECQTCGARRNMKEVKDRQKFPSHPSRKTPPPKGELRWVLRESAWTLAEN